MVNCIISMTQTNLNTASKRSHVTNVSVTSLFSTMSIQFMNMPSDSEAQLQQPSCRSSQLEYSSDIRFLSLVQQVAHVGIPSPSLALPCEEPRKVTLDVVLPLPVSIFVGSGTALINELSHGPLLGLVAFLCLHLCFYGGTMWRNDWRQHLRRSLDLRLLAKCLE
ncbi:hypothetical protein BJ165DRAFT_393161 [Panaeolus papilionaceus]|nr:hypothetical protein BJ165DRAFT_393161 [Panaeolus papilionaceus]